MNQTPRQVFKIEKLSRGNLHCIELCRRLVRIAMEKFHKVRQNTNTEIRNNELYINTPIFPLIIMPCLIALLWAWQGTLPHFVGLSLLYNRVSHLVSGRLLNRMDIFGGKGRDYYISSSLFWYITYSLGVS